MKYKFEAVFWAATIVLAGPALAQEGVAGDSQETASAAETAQPAATPVEMSAPALAVDGADAKTCELRVWPTENYLGVNTGLLSGFGLIGALADVAAHDGRVKTVKDLMRDYLGPEVQMEELRKLGLLKTLKLPDNYQSRRPGTRI